jgi:hypothetical protein
MTIYGKPKRVPRKAKKQMGKQTYDLLMKHENTVWRVDIRLDCRVNPPKTLYLGYKLFNII